MRNHGTRTELVQLRPHDHLGWFYSGEAEFTALATSFLAEGAVRGELLMYVSESPDVDGPLATFIGSVDPGHLQVASIAEVYGTSGFVDPVDQRATFAAVLTDALRDGFPGIRVAADNTSLVIDPDRRARWMHWEMVADDFMSQNPVTGLCAFDRDRVDVDVLRHLSTLHPLSPVENPVPQFRVFVDEGTLWIEGDVNAMAVDQAMTALERMPWMTDVVVDLTATSFVTESLKARLSMLSATDVNVAVLEGSMDLPTEPEAGVTP